VVCHKELGNIHITTLGGMNESSLPFVILFIEPRPLGNKYAGNFRIPVYGSRHQCGNTLFLDAGQQFLTLEIGVGTRRQKGLSDIHMACPGCLHEGGGTIDIRDVGVSPLLEQDVHNTCVPHDRGTHQGCHSIRIPCVHVGPLEYQIAHRVFVTL